MVEMFELILRLLTWCTLCNVVEISSKALKETNVRYPESLAKEGYLSTVCDVVEISFKASKETIVREILSQEK